MERQWMTLDQIKVEYASNDYNPELLLQHLLRHVEASPASVPGGYAIVPVEPTPEMLTAGECESDSDRATYETVYAAMIAAAPTPATWPDGTPRAFDNYAHDKQFSEDSPTPPVSEDRWLPIETAPKYGRILAVMPSGAMSVIVWLEASHPDADGEGWYEHWKFDPVDPTHWMPLPKSPAMQEDKPCQIS